MTRLSKIIKEVLSTKKKKDCNCGCGGCAKKSPTLTENKVKKFITEGLQYHITNNISLFESVYRIGSEKHLDLINEARALWVRGLMDVSEDDQALLETHLGHFGLYEGVEVPLDLPMLNEVEIGDRVKIDKAYGGGNGEVKDKIGSFIVVNGKSYHESDVKLIKESSDYDEIANDEFGMDYEQLGQNEKEWVRDEMDNMSINEKEGVPHFTKDGKEWKGKVHKMPNGKLMTQNPHNEDSEELFHKEDLKENNLLKQAKLSSEEYQKAKKLKGFNADDYTFSSDNNLYVKKSSLDEAMVDWPGEFMYGDKRYVFFKQKDGRVTYEHEKYKGDRLTFGSKKEMDDFLGDYTAPKGGTQSTNLGESLEERIGRILEAKEKKDPPLNKPKRGGSKAYYVYVRDPKTKKIKKVSFGSGGLRAKIKNKQARNAFAARHNCDKKKDRTTAGYWSCNLPKYADQLGLGSNMNTFW